MQNTIQKGHDARRSLLRRSLFVALLSASFVAPNAIAANAHPFVSNPLRSDSITSDAPVTAATPIIRSPQRDESASSQLESSQLESSQLAATATSTSDSEPVATLRLLSGQLVDSSDESKVGRFAASEWDATTEAHTTLAIDLIGGLIGGPLPPIEHPIATHAAQSQRPSAIDNDHLPLILQPTTGRFQQQGVSWVFLPDQAMVARIVKRKVESHAKPVNHFRESSAVNSLRRSTQNIVELLPANPFRPQASDWQSRQIGTHEFFREASSQSKTVDVLQRIPLQQAAVANDLILQRVVQMIRKRKLSEGFSSVATSEAQPSFNAASYSTSMEGLRWEITGELSVAQDRHDGIPNLSLHSVKPLQR